MTRTSVGSPLSESQAHVRTEVVNDLGHFNTLEEVDNKKEELWGAIERCEEEGSIPWHRVYICQYEGFHLCTITLYWNESCKGKVK